MGPVGWGGMGGLLPCCTVGVPAGLQLLRLKERARRQAGPALSWSTLLSDLLPTATTANTAGAAVLPGVARTQP